MGEHRSKGRYGWMWGGLSYESYVCIPCRYVRSSYGERCPQGHDLVNMGRNFKAPRKRDDAAWRAIARVVSRRGTPERGFRRARRTHNTLAELKQADVPVRSMPGARKPGQWPFVMEQPSFNNSITRRGHRWHQ